MASEIGVPRLGWNMEEGIFLGWLRREGEAVRAGDPLFTLEAIAQDVEAAEDGASSTSRRTDRRRGRS